MPRTTVAKPQPRNVSIVLPHSAPGVPTITDLGRTLARLRRQRGLRVEALARIADCTAAWLAGAERGAFGPTWTELGLLAQALDLPVSSLVEEIEREARARESGRPGRAEPPDPP